MKKAKKEFGDGRTKEENKHLDINDLKTYIEQITRPCGIRG